MKNVVRLLSNNALLLLLSLLVLQMLAESLLACYESSVSCGKPLALRVFVSGRGRLEDEGATALAQAFKVSRYAVT